MRGKTDSAWQSHYAVKSIRFETKTFTKSLGGHIKIFTVTGRPLHLFITIGVSDRQSPVPPNSPSKRTRPSHSAWVKSLCQVTRKDWGAPRRDVTWPHATSRVWRDTWRQRGVKYGGLGIHEIQAYSHLKRVCRLPARGYPDPAESPGIAAHRA